MSSDRWGRVEEGARALVWAMVASVLILGLVLLVCWANYTFGYNDAQEQIPDCAEDEVLDATTRPWREVKVSELICTHPDNYNT